MWGLWAGIVINGSIVPPQVCTGRGECKCGKCNCNTSKATGEYCQFCPSCEDKKYCNQTFECVADVCKVLYGSPDNCSQTCDFEYQLVDVLTEQNSSSASVPFKYQCHQRTLDNECDISFIYERTDEPNNKKIFRITKPVKSCKERINLVVVSGSVAAGVLLIGLALLLIWKLITELWDRQEYARFQKELTKVNWEQVVQSLHLSLRFIWSIVSVLFCAISRVRTRSTKRPNRRSRTQCSATCVRGPLKDSPGSQSASPEGSTLIDHIFDKSFALILHSKRNAIILWSDHLSGLLITVQTSALNWKFRYKTAIKFTVESKYI